MLYNSHCRLIRCADDGNEVLMITDILNKGCFQREALHKM